MTKQELEQAWYEYETEGSPLESAMAGALVNGAFSDCLSFAILIVATLLELILLVIILFNITVYLPVVLLTIIWTGLVSAGWVMVINEW